MVKLKHWDSTEYLRTEEDIALYWAACLEEAGDDLVFLEAARATVARARERLARDEPSTPDV